MSETTEAPSTTTTAAAEERVSTSSQYGSIDRPLSSDLPPKPAVRQRTLTRQANNNNSCSQDKQAQDLSTRKSSSGSTSTRDELNRELQAELSRKLSLARSRLEQSEQLEQQLKGTTTSNSNSNHDSHQQPTKKTADLSLSMSMGETAAALRRESSAADDGNDVCGDLPPTRAYPKKVFFIIANEFCERFSYYGLRTVLVMYLTGVLKFTDSNSTITFHLFAMLCYVTPILGAILGDSILGKFKTIFYLSIVYFVGEFVLLVSSIFWNNGQLSVWSTFAGLLLIGVGTGGIKPCVSALGGDQFLPHEEKWRQSFFSLFYAAINLGSLITVFVTPLLRTEFQCVGRQDCFPYAFGLPCALMFLSIVVFLLAKNQYHLAPLPADNVIVSFCKCIWLALKRKLTYGGPKFVLDDNLAIVTHKHKSGGRQHSASSSDVSESSSNEETLASQSSNTHLAPGAAAHKSSTANKRHRVQGLEQEEEERSKRRSHWLYLAADKFDSRSIEAFRSVLGLLLLFIPTLVYWCLFDQQGSLWTLQATRMDGHIFGGKFVLQPDQMGVANPLILLAVIPLFEVFIYPCLGRCNLLKKPLQRMTVGGFIASLAFLSSAAIEMRIKQFMPPNEPPTGWANLILVNGLRECSLVNPTISHIPMPDVLSSSSAVAAANPLIAVISQNQTTIPPAAVGPPEQAGRTAAPPTTIRLNSLEALAVQSIDVRSINTSTLFNNYQLKLKLADSLEQIKSNKSFGCPIAGSSAAIAEHEFSFAPLADRATRLLYLELGNGKLTYKIFNESLELAPSNKARVRLLYEFFGSSAQAEKRQFSLVPSRWSRLNNGTSPSASTSTSAVKAEDRKVFRNSLRDGQVFLSEYADIEVPTAGAPFLLESSDSKLIWTNGGGSASEGSNVLLLEAGTRNLIIVHQSDANHVWLKHQLLQDNKYRVNMLYQLIPYTLISMSEVMFSITGLEFSYSMAPASMKSVLLAIWSLTVALGNLLTVFVESLNMFSDVAHEFMFYAGLMALDMCIFAIMGRNFRPNKYHGQ